MDENEDRGVEYRVTAHREVGGGLREDVSSEVTMGAAYGLTYATRAEAQEDVEELVRTWDPAWDLGACPVYEVEEV